MCIKCRIKIDCKLQKIDVFGCRWDWGPKSTLLQHSKIHAIDLWRILVTRLYYSIPEHCISTLKPEACNQNQEEVPKPGIHKNIGLEFPHKTWC